MLERADLFPKDLNKIPFEKNSPEHLLRSFFETKKVEDLRLEDKNEDFYDDFVFFLEKTKLYSLLLSPKNHRKDGGCFDIHSISRFMEYFAFHSPSHAYSLQVSFLGIFPFLMSANEEIKKKAIESLQNGKLFAFGLSEKEHGSDLYSSETRITTDTGGDRIVNGRKYYIGNANCAEMISILAVNEKKEFTFFALWPKESKSFLALKKIRTLGVKTAFVGAFQIQKLKLVEKDIISEGKSAWNAIFGTVNLGKFFLGLGSIGICEHAFTETLHHVRKRTLFEKPVLEMPHIQKSLCQAYVKLLSMKLFAYRAADYLSLASESDRRYLLTNSVQKAKVSTQGVQVMQALSECMGAKGFESSTHFESALRDIALIPSLEGSTHINYGIIASFARNYFFNNKKIKAPSKIYAPIENEFLFNAKTGGIKDVYFPKYEKSFQKLNNVKTTAIFLNQVSAFRSFLKLTFLIEKASSLFRKKSKMKMEAAEYIFHLGKIVSTIVYAQLIAEAIDHEKIENEISELIFESLSHDLNGLLSQLPSQMDSKMALKPILHAKLKSAIMFCNSNKSAEIKAVELMKKHFI